ncbi:secretion system protein [Actinoplanes sp. SE50]|nr:type II secretion system protein [Actinoplanes sp. SE50/110]ATO79781.1 secretion system protein [Actinoplanes sp. SE50]SLL97183.1 secretion system protein [Actinoplanes sp. SE50/110]
MSRWGRAGRRLGRLRSAGLSDAARSRSPDVAADPVPARRRHALLGLLAGASAAGLVGGWWGLPVGLVTAIGVERALRNQEPADVRRERHQAGADLPLGVDLLAAALRAGAPVDRAAAAVADAVGGPLGARMQRTARSLRLGAGPAEAWAHLAGLPGADRLTATAIRSSASGGALAAALERLAGDLRADRAVATQAAAERAAVFIVLPLGLCFLPAFLLAGLVPVLIAVLGRLL